MTMNGPTKPKCEHSSDWNTCLICRPELKNQPPKQQLRRAFIQTLTELAEKDDKVLLIVGDVGFSYMEDFIQRFPKQFLNAGIAEQNMMGMAAGLSLVGYKPYVYTMSNFIILRPLEQLRNDICYSNANVKLFGVKGGPAYKFLGHSHNLMPGEERAVLEHLPNISKHFPELETDVSYLMKYEFYEHNGPAYFSI